MEVLDGAAGVFGWARRAETAASLRAHFGVIYALQSFFQGMFPPSTTLAGRDELVTYPPPSCVPSPTFFRSHPYLPSHA